MITLMTFTGGQKGFAVFFLVAFILGIAWAYRKDARLQKTYFKDSYKLLLVIAIAMAGLYLLVKTLG